MTQKQVRSGPDRQAQGKPECGTGTSAGFGQYASDPPPVCQAFGNKTKHSTFKHLVRGREGLDEYIAIDIEAGFMKKWPQFLFATVAVAAALFCFCTPPALGAEPIQMGIMTGGPKGTYYQFGLNLQELAKRAGIELRVDNSKGSVENIYAVYQKPKTQLGIVQSDVLAFVAEVETNPVLDSFKEMLSE
jgi:hypothetical protein